MSSDSVPPPRRGRARIILGWFGIVIGVAGLFGVFAQRRAAERQRETLRRLADDFRKQEQKRTGAVVWDGREVRPGDRVRIAKWAGTVKPDETGLAVEVDAGHGRVGVVLRGERRQSTDYMKIDPKEPIQIVRVRWDPQKWKQFGRDHWIELPQFESTVHVSYLEVLR